MVKAAQIAAGPPSDEENKPKKAVQVAPQAPQATIRFVESGTKIEDRIWTEVEKYLPKHVKNDPRTARRVGWLAGFYGEQALAKILRKIIS